VLSRIVPVIALLAFTAPAALGDAGPLTLDTVLARTLRDNPQLAVYPYEIRIAEAQRIQAGLRPNPELSLEIEDIQMGGAGSAKTSARSFATGSGPEVSREIEEDGPRGFRESEFTLGLSQLIELGGKRASRIAAADKAISVAQQDYEVARADILTQAAAAFHDVLAQQERVDLLRQLAALAGEARAATAARVEAGKVSPLELTRAETEAAHALAGLQKAEKTLDANRIALSAYWGQTEPDFTRAEGAFLVTEPPPSADTLQAQLEQLPELRRWMAEIEHRDALVALEKAQRVPSPTVTLGWRFQGQDGRDTASRAIGAEGLTVSHAHTAPDDDWDHRLVAGFSIPLPLFDNNRGAIAEAEHRADQAKAERNAAFKQALARARILHETLAGSYGAIQALDATLLPKATQTFEGVQEGYRQGKFALIDVLDAQRTLFDLRIQLLEETASYRLTLTELQRLTGAP